jgi:hypothetical protein
MVEDSNLRWFGQYSKFYASIPRALAAREFGKEELKFLKRLGSYSMVTKF